MFSNKCVCDVLNLVEFRTQTQNKPSKILGVEMIKIDKATKVDKRMGHI